MPRGRFGRDRVYSRRLPHTRPVNLARTRNYRRWCKPGSDAFILKHFMISDVPVEAAHRILTFAFGSPERP